MAVLLPDLMDGVGVSAEANRPPSAIRKWKRKAAFSKPSSEVNGAATGTEKFSSKIVDGELVYKDELTADSGRLTQR